MVDEAARRSAAAIPGEAQGIKRPCGPMRAFATSTAEPRGRCNDNTKSAATCNVLGLSKLQSALPRGCPARHRRRDGLAATVCCNFDCYARCPARQCCVAAGMDAAPASRCNHHRQEQVTRFGGLSGSLAASQEARLGAGGFAVHGPHCRAHEYAKDSAPLPADKASLLTGERSRFTCKDQVHQFSQQLTHALAPEDRPWSAPSPNVALTSQPRGLAA